MPPLLQRGAIRTVLILRIRSQSADGVDCGLKHLVKTPVMIRLASERAPCAALFWRSVHEASIILCVYFLYRQAEHYHLIERQTIHQKTEKAMSENQKLAYEPQNAWKTYAEPKDAKAMNDLARRYIDFLSNCKTERETVNYVVERLKEAGYAQGLGAERGFKSMRGKALFAARKGKSPLSEGFNVLSAHVDSPRLDFKQRPLFEQAQVAQARTHYYGGIRKYQWLARPLALHGVLVKQDGEKVNVVLGEEPGEPVFSIADLLPHLAAKQQTQTIADAFEAEKLNVIIGHSPSPEEKEAKGSSGENKENSKDAAKDPIKKHVLDLIFKKYGVREEDFISAEMQAVPAGAARFVGFDEALIGGYGHDDRVCVFAALEAFLNTKDENRPSVLILWDREEIGSEGATGASSIFFEACVEELIKKWEPQASLYDIMLASRALSCDVQAALDPDWQELHEKQNAALLGHGPCFSKFTGSRGKYGASEADAEYVAFLRGVLNKRNIPWQMAECGKVDVGGGGTVALFLAAYGMNVVDMGPAVLGMHSPFELISKVDLYASVAAFEAFLQN